MLEIGILKNMRPTIMVAEAEPLQALSVRKLVLESAKFNVLTAHSTEEALEICREFPRVAAAVLVDENGIQCELLAAAIKKSHPSLPVVALSARHGYFCRGADHHLSSYNAEELVDVARQLLGDPRKIDASEK